MRVPSGDQAGGFRLNPLANSSPSSGGDVLATKSLTKRSNSSVVGAPAVPAAKTTFVRSGDQLGWRFCVPAMPKGSLSAPLPVLPTAERRYSWAMLSLGPSRPLRNAIRPLRPSSTAEAGPAWVRPARLMSRARPAAALRAVRRRGGGAAPGRSACMGGGPLPWGGGRGASARHGRSLRRGRWSDVAGTLRRSASHGLEPELALE